jgi:cystathionine beta-lyase/cystathionine gamma-synthase
MSEDRPETLLNHPPEVRVPADNRPLVAPIHQSVKYEFEAVDEALRLFAGERDGFFYQRSGNPTTRQLEQTLAKLQGREECIATASGVAAINGALMALTAQGDHVLCFMEGYGPTRIFVRRTLARFGVRHTLLSIEDLEGVERVLGETPTKLMVFESPTNPVNKVADLDALCELARRHGTLTLLDNTLAGPHQHGRFPVDVFLHSLTKYVSGHGDVMGGAVIGDAALLRRLRGEFTNLGGVPDPHASFLLQRGLRTYFTRYRAQSAAALRVAQHLAGHAAVAAVPAGRPLARARTAADGRCRLRAERRAGGRGGGGQGLCRRAAPVRERRQPRHHRVAGDALADADRARPRCRPAAAGRPAPGPRAVVDRPGGRGRPARRP